MDSTRRLLSSKLLAILFCLSLAAACNVRIIDKGTGSKECRPPEGVQSVDDYLKLSPCNGVTVPAPSASELQALIDELPSTAVDRQDAVKRLPGVVQSICVSLAGGASTLAVTRATIDWFESAEVLMASREAGDLVELVRSQLWCSGWKPTT